jgi:hypothetical protein
MVIQFKRKGSFNATDSAFRLYEVVIRQECFYGDSAAYTPQQFLNTVDGERVTRRCKGQHLITRTGELLRSVDPSCP